MTDIAISFGVFVVAFMSHIGFHRFLRRRSKRSLVSFVPFAIGLIVVILLVDTLPLTTIFFYSFLSIFYCIYAMSPFLGDEGPTAKILSALSTHPQGLTENRLRSVLSDVEIIDKRIDDLIHSGWITKKDSRFISTHRGGRIAQWILWYRSVLRIGRSG